MIDMAQTTILRPQEAADLGWLLEQQTPDRITDTHWQTRGVCAQTDPEAYFPDKGDSVKHAQKVCGGCEVRAQCLTWALSTDERYGVWGGHTEAARSRMRKQWKNTVEAGGSDPADGQR